MIGHVITPTPVSVVCEINTFGYVNTPTAVCVVCVKESFGCLITPTLVSVIHLEGQVYLCEHSYFCVC